MKYRKKPAIIEAWIAKELSHIIGQDWYLGILPECIEDAYEKGGWVFLTSGEIHIPTLEGTMIAQPDDYIIQGVSGEFYPCKPDIFKLTYEEVYETYGDDEFEWIDVDSLPDFLGVSLSEKIENLGKLKQLGIKLN